MNLNTITIEVAKLAKKVGAYIKTQHNNISDTDIEHKGLHDLVTFVDKEAEHRIVKGLTKILPEAGFIAEENQALKKKEAYNWIIDPLDGTTNFIHGVPVFSVSIALALNDEVISGVIYEINQDECFYAWKNGGAYLNNKRILVSSTKKLNDSLIATGFPYADYTRLKHYLGLFEELMKSTRGLRRLGSAAVDMAYLACGRFDVFYEYGLNPWDVAGGIIIVKEAGGHVTDFKGGEDFLFGREIIASNNQVYTEFTNLLKQHFDEHI
jgi:myo-inositol-1(or 4)-monophosphatase